MVSLFNTENFRILNTIDANWFFFRFALHFALHVILHLKTLF